MGKLGTYTRRGFLAVGGLVGGGLALGIAFPPNRLAVKPSPGALNTWITITPDSRITVLVPHCDMGQGALTALGMMAAEELDADWAQMDVREAPALPEFGNGYIVREFAVEGMHPPRFLRHGIDAATYGLAALVGTQITGGSASVRATGEFGMRVAGAGARQMLVQAAAARWDVAPDTIAVSKGRVLHTQSGRHAQFGELAAEAAALPPPRDPRLKPWNEWTLLGSSPPRPDIPGKTDGTAQYAIDMKLPGMLYAAVNACPVFGGKLVSVDIAPALKLPGVQKVVKLDDAVAVVATSYWRALNGLRALSPQWDETGHETVSSASIAQQLGGLLGTDGKTQLHHGDTDAAFTGAAHVIEAAYAVPYLAHATMEVPNATVRIDNGQCDVWCGVQDPLQARAVAASAAGLSRADVTLHNFTLGGGFGRKTPFQFDWIDQATRIANACSPSPVKTIWSREEDMTHGFYRPTAAAHFRAALDKAGTPVALASHYTGDAGENADEILYQIPNLRIAASAYKNHVRTGPWRSVDHSQHGYFTESFIDELAVAAGRDPYEFRRDLLPPGRHRTVLETVAQRAGWGSPMPKGTGRGIALIAAFGSIVAQVMEVRVDADGTVRPLRAVVAVDCGDVVHRDTAIAQVEGGVMFGLAAALYGEISIENGRVKQDNFDTYPVARMADAPLVEVHFVPSHATRGGMGEVGVPAAAPALCNAIFAATGQRVRHLPVRSLAAQRASL